MLPVILDTALETQPAADHHVPFCRPTTPSLERVKARLEPSYATGSLTNGRLVQQLEEATALRLGVANVVAVASCTSGLMLTLRVLGVRTAGVLPSFTFCASAHAMAWNGIRPVFAECDPSTLQLDVEDARRRMQGAEVLMGVHMFGAPCPAEQLEVLAATLKVPLLFDAAHAFGAQRGGRPIGGFGSAEVFSLSPTKPLVAGEGGLVATNDSDLADAIRIGRDYGNPGTYDTLFVGMNARMSEFHAAVALESLEHFDHDLARRRSIAHDYQSALSTMPGLVPQAIDADDESTFKDFTILVNEQEFGLSRDALASALGSNGIQTRRYFYPPVHRQHAYAALPFAHLPVTDDVASQCLSLPMFPGITPSELDRVCVTLQSLSLRTEELANVAGLCSA